MECGEVVCMPLGFPASNTQEDRALPQQFVLIHCGHGCDTIMAGFLRSFDSLGTLCDRFAFSVVDSAARKVIEVAMLGLPAEAQSIFTILAQHSDATGPLTSRVPAEAQFLYELTGYTPIGVEHTDKDELKRLKVELVRKIPYLPGGVDVLNGEEKDFQILKDWYELEKNKSETGTECAAPGYYVNLLSILLRPGIVSRFLAT